METIREIVEADGFVFEAHEVHTEDGYILEIHRLYKQEHKDKGNEMPAVFLQHGILGSSECFILNGKDSAAYKFANQGYDVWLGNNRGTIYGYRHETLNPFKKTDQQQFFDYSFFELGLHDLPANIDFIRLKTGNAKVAYVGHSQGTSQMFTALANGYGDVQDKISIFIALAPITHLLGSPSSYFKTIS
jgi:lysosomal acid lipase/cholesteryl ester hydrolase